MKTLPSVFQNIKQLYVGTVNMKSEALEADLLEQI